MKFISVFSFLILITYITQSQTNIPAGYVSGTWTSVASPYIIQGNIEIHYDSTLIIEPGVDVLFDGSYKLTVHGLLNASGTEADSIRFTAIDTVIGWQGIEFIQINENLGTSNVKYCNLTYSRKPSGYGGAIYVFHADDILISSCLITNNYADRGGGIYIDDGWIDILNCKITRNQADEYAGGIACLNSAPYFSDLEITYNYSQNAGGIFFGYNPAYSYPYFENLIIEYNRAIGAGGMILDLSDNLVLDNCRIAYNDAESVGGIALLYSSLSFWDYYDERNRIYMNKGGIAHDLYYEGNSSTIINVDTFTVVNPDSYVAYPLNKFNFLGGIDFGLIQQADTDLYLSNTGSDANDGLTPENPLRSFDFALRKIKSDPDNNHTLWVLPGQYHLNESDAADPIYVKDNVKIKATVTGESIINADSISRVIFAQHKNNFTLSGLTLKNGYTVLNGGGIYIYYSNGSLDSCELISNSAQMLGGGIFLQDIYHVTINHCRFIKNSSIMEGGGLCNYYPSSYSNLIINYCEFIENHSYTNGGGLFFDGQNAKILGCVFNGNSCDYNGAGLYYRGQMEPLINCLFVNNSAGLFGGGAFVVNGTDSKIINCTFSDNIATKGSGIFLYNGDDLNFINTVFWNSIVPYNDMVQLDWGASCNIYYSGIQGGEDAIGIEGNGSHYHWEDGNITSDPAFVDPSIGDYCLNWNSPCIEAGKEDTTGLNLPEYDLNGNPRIVNPRVDMGAYEFQMPVEIKSPIMANNRIKIYPAITDHEVNIEFPAELWNEKRRIRFYSSDGKILKSIDNNTGYRSIKIDVSDLSAGIYIIVIEDDKSKKYSERMIIAR